MEKILVTGATGFLGWHTALRLKREGFYVTGIGRSLARGARLEEAGVAFAPADISQPEGLAQIFRGHSRVIHCAALSSPWGRYEEFYAANVTATENVIAAARVAGVTRFVHVSTPSLYIDHSDRLDVQEDDPLPKQGINHYAVTKRLAELRIDAAVKEGFPALCLRPQGIIGEGDSAIFPRLLRLAKRKILLVIGEGDNWVDLTHVDNVVEALLLALQAPDFVHGRKYNITNGEPVRLYQVLERVFHDLGFSFRKKQIPFRRAYHLASGMEFVCRNFLRGTEPLLTRYTVCALGLSRTLHIGAACRDLGYKPIINMDEAVHQVTRTLHPETSL